MAHGREVKVLVLDGGPCGLKSTALVYLAERFRGLGFEVCVLPELATWFMLECGVSPEKVSLRDFEILILKSQRFLEDLLKEYLRCTVGKKPLLVICDRGIPTLGAYFKDPDELLLLVEKLTDGMQAVFSRYNTSVIFMHSLAYDRPDLYREFWQSNPARREKTPEEARKLNERTMRAWYGHERIFYVGNYDDPEKKLRRAFQCACHALGLPHPLEIEKKFKVSGRIRFGAFPIQRVEIEQAYLVSSDSDPEVRVRKTTQDGASVYSRTEKRDVRLGVRGEMTTTISAYDYLNYLAYRDPKFDLVRKDRYYFTWQEQTSRACQYFALDVFREPKRVKGLSILEAELTDENDTVTPPPIFGAVLDVTTDKGFTNREIARVR